MSVPKVLYHQIDVGGNSGDVAKETVLIPLEDTRWSKYPTRNGTGAELATLLGLVKKTDEDYYRILHACCDLQIHDVFSAAYLAFPHLVNLAKNSGNRIDCEWPMVICGAVCSCFKASKTREDVPEELWDDFASGIDSAQLLIADKARSFANGVEPIKNLIYVFPVLRDIEAKSFFGTPVPGDTY